MTLHIDMIKPDTLAAERPPGQHITWPEIKWPEHDAGGTLTIMGGGTDAPGDGGAMTIPANSKLHTWVTAEDTDLHWPPFAVAEPKPSRWRLAAAGAVEAAVVFFAVFGLIHAVRMVLP